MNPEYRTIDRLVLDAHGVVFSDSFRQLISNLAKLSEQDAGKLWQTWLADIRYPAWSGQITETEIWNRLGVGHLPRQRKQMLETAFDVGPAGVHLETWNQHVPIWILSNHRSEWLLPRLQRFGLAKYCERVLISDQLGFVKPDESTFRSLIEGVSSTDRILYVDDKQRNLDAAHSLGMRAILADQNKGWPDEVTRLLIGSSTACG